MSSAASGYFYPTDLSVIEAQTRASAQRQSTNARLVFLLPVIISGLSYLVGGLPRVTDLSFLLLTALCAIYLIVEIRKFPDRLGIGYVLIYSGALIWFCHDYLYDWLGADFTSGSALASAAVIAKAAFCHCLFVWVMTLAVEVQVPFLGWVDRFVVAVPEPSRDSVYVVILSIAMAIGISPFFYAVNEPFYEALYRVIALTSGDLHWKIGRTFIGHAVNLNYNWGGYVVEILNVGQLGGILGAAYAILLARTVIGKLFGWFCWYFWVAYAFPELRRGELVFAVLPAVGFLYFRYQVWVSTYFRRLGWRSYVTAGGLLVALLFIVEYESALRSNGKMEFLRPRGNTMFSESLKEWTYFPDQNNGRFFEDDFPGEAYVRPIPDTIFQLITDPIPRALWPDKYIDPFIDWHNRFESGEASGLTGTTISDGAVGYWYFRYGIPGVIQGALIYGWLMGVCQRAMRHSGYRAMGLLLSMAFVVIIFRLYRDMWLHVIDSVLVAGVALYVIVKISGSRPSHRSPEIYAVEA